MSGGTYYYAVLPTSADFPPRRGAFHPRFGVVLGFAQMKSLGFIAMLVREMCFHFNKQYSNNETKQLAHSHYPHTLGFDIQYPIALALQPIRA